MSNRRNFFKAAGAVALGATAVSRVGAASLPEAVLQSSAATQPPPTPSTGRPFNPVITLNGWSLPWRMKDNVKEFHLVCEPVVREFAPGMKVNMWGFNGSSPGPTIEAVEGDRVRIFVTNKLPEPTAIHWHGILVPNGMDGVSGLTQPPIPVGKTFVYEFTLPRAGSHFYHTHLDEQLQSPWACTAQGDASTSPSPRVRARGNAGNFIVVSSLSFIRVSSQSRTLTIECF